MYFIPILTDKQNFRGLKKDAVYTLEEFRQQCSNKEYEFTMLGKSKSCLVKPQGHLDLIWIPLRVYAEGRRGQITWDSRSRTIIFNIEKDTYKFNMCKESGVAGVYKNGDDEVYGNTRFKIIDGTTLVPLINTSIILKIESDFWEISNTYLRTVCDYDNMVVITDNFKSEED